MQQLRKSSNYIPLSQFADFRRFAEHKISYQEKKKSGRATLEDDVHFMQAESAENSRQKRLRSDHKWPHHKANLYANPI